MENGNLSTNKWTTMMVTKIVYTVMSNNTPDRYGQATMTSKKFIGKGKWYFKENKERLQKMARDWYKGLSEEEKDKKREYARSKYQNMSTEKKQKIKQREKNWIRSMTQNEKLERQVEQVTEHMKDLLKALQN